MDALRRAVHTEQRKLEEEVVADVGFPRHSSSTVLSSSSAAWRRVDRLAVRAQSEANSPLWTTGFCHPMVTSPTPGRDNLLCARATERGACWGSLRSSWLAKNTFEEWRSAVLKRHLSEDRDRHVDIVLLEENNRDNRAIEMMNQLSSSFEQRSQLFQEHLLGELRGELRGLRRGLSESMDALKRDLTRATVETVNEHAGKARGVYDSIDCDIVSSIEARVEQLLARHEQGSLEATRLCAKKVFEDAVKDGRLLDSVRDIEVQPQITDIAYSVSQLQDCLQRMQIQPQISDIADNVSQLQAHVQRLEKQFKESNQKMLVLEAEESKVETALENILEGHRSWQRAEASAVAESHRRELDRALATQREQLHLHKQDFVAKLADLEMTIKTPREVDHSEVLAAIRRLDHTPVIDAIRNQEVDQSEVLTAIRRLDHTPVLDAIRNHEVDHSEVLAAIRRCSKQWEQSAQSQAEKVDKALKLIQDHLAPQKYTIEEEIQRGLHSFRRQREEETKKMQEALDIVLNHSQKSNEVLHSVRDLRKEIGSTIHKVEVDHSPVLEALREIGHGYKMHLAPLHDQLRASHRSIQERIDPLHDQLQAGHRSIHERIEASLRTMPRTSIEASLQERIDAIHDQLQASHRSIHERIEAPPTAHIEQLQAVVAGYEAQSSVLAESLVKVEQIDQLQAQLASQAGSIQDVQVNQLGILKAIEGVSTAVTTMTAPRTVNDHGAFAQLVKSNVEVQDAIERFHLQVHDAVRASREETVRDVVAAVETAVDQSPLLQAIGSHQLKGHSEAHAEVMASLKALRLDLNMEPDFSPVLHALRELPSAAEHSQMQSGMQRIKMDLSSLLTAVSTGHRDLISAFEASVDDRRRESRTRRLDDRDSSDNQRLEDHGQERLSPGPPQRRRYIVTLGDSAQAKGALENINAGMAQAAALHAGACASPLHLGHSSYLVDASG